MRSALIVAMVTGLLLLPVLPAPPASAQARGYRAPRTSDGKPDLSGIWQTFGDANWDIEPHASAAPAIPLTGAIGAVPPGMGVVDGGVIPYKPEALAQKRENYKNRHTLDPEAKCYQPGVPRANYMPHPFQIFQTPSQLLLSYQFAGAVRTIYMSDPGPAPTDFWMGWSVGRWEGETLVVTVTNLNDKTWFDRAGNHHSDAMRVTERYTRTGPDHLLYEATIEDPNVFTRPWKISLPLYRRIESNARLMEFKCVEYSEELIYGHLRKQPVK